MATFDWFFTKAIWTRRLSEFPLYVRIPLRWFRIAVVAVVSFLRDDCQKNAAVLTYYSLLNIVPVFAVMFGIAKGFGLQAIVEKQIIRLAENANWQPEVTSRIIDFSTSLLEHAKGGVIAGVGVALLLWTVVSILGRIEESFNTIWGISRPRSYIRKFTDYLAIMVFAPVLIVISSSASLIIASQLEVMIKAVSFLHGLGPLIYSLFRVIPYLSIWLLLTCLYIVLPNGRIPFRSGLLAGVVAGTVYQLIQFIYITFQVGVASYGAIYGSFAALPLFLVWLQLSWTIVLFGAEIAYAHDNYESYGFHPDMSTINEGTRKLLALVTFHHIVKRFSLGQNPPDAAAMAADLEIPRILLRPILAQMVEAGLVTETTIATGKATAFVPARPLEHLTLQYFLETYDRNNAVLRKFPEREPVLRHLTDFYELARQSPGNRHLKDI